MKLDELNVYKLSMEMAERIWEIVVKWDYFTKDTLGKQLVKAADSIAANLSEGFGRYHYKEIQISVIIQEGHYMKQKPGLQKPITEISFRMNHLSHLIMR